MLRPCFSVNSPDSHSRRGPRESADVIGLAAQRNACPGLLTQHRKNGGARRTEHLDPRGGLRAGSNLRPTDYELRVRRRALFRYGHNPCLEMPSAGLSSRQFGRWFGRWFPGRPTPLRPPSSASFHGVAASRVSVAKSAALHGKQRFDAARRLLARGLNRIWLAHRHLPQRPSHEVPPAPASSYSSCGRIQNTESGAGESPSSRPFGTRSRIG